MKTNSSRRIKKPWPTKAAMEQIYRTKLWGDNGKKFYSGDGSHHPELVGSYVESIRSFLKSFKYPLTVIDLGCGDFNVGMKLVKYAKRYIAVDIVQDLIQFNQNKFHKPNLEFHCLDIAKDPLPKADCVILRQVLQHLSNSEIKSIVNKLYDYQYVILTEHVPLGNFTPNIDIISGQGTRLKHHSGVNICKAPFHFKPKEVKQILFLNSLNHGGKLMTTLFQMF